MKMPLHTGPDGCAVGNLVVDLAVDYPLTTDEAVLLRNARTLRRSGCYYKLSDIVDAYARLLPVERASGLVALADPEPEAAAWVVPTVGYVRGPEVMLDAMKSSASPTRVEAAAWLCRHGSGSSRRQAAQRLAGRLAECGPRALEALGWCAKAWPRGTAPEVVACTESAPEQLKSVDAISTMSAAAGNSPSLARRATAVLRQVEQLVDEPMRSFVTKTRRWLAGEGPPPSDVPLSNRPGYRGDVPLCDWIWKETGRIVRQAQEQADIELLGPPRIAATAERDDTACSEPR